MIPVIFPTLVKPFFVPLPEVVVYLIIKGTKKVMETFCQLRFEFKSDLPTERMPNLY
jgi:hypothetical protein